MAMRIDGRAALLASAVAAVAMTAGTPRESHAQGTWCARSFDRDVGTAENCGFYSFEQCLATVHGWGGICARNLSIPEPMPATKQPSKKSRRDQK
jgi:hypothetical protein